MLFSRASLMLACTALVAAAPHSQEEKTTWDTKSGDFYAWSPRKARSGEQPQSTTFTNTGYQVGPQGTCDVSKLVMPDAPKPLPPVSEGLQLYHVALGRGTQNYTCDLSNKTAIPVAAGAVATLYNLTCVDQCSEGGLRALTVASKMAMLFNLTDYEESKRDLSGHHYFTDATTAYFNLDTTAYRYGAGGFKKVNATDAPNAKNTSSLDGMQHGTVPWLKLVSKDDGDEENSFCKEVYRIRTEGGQSPKTCEGQASEFQIQYAAEYWFYS